MDQTTSLSFSYNMNEVILKDNKQYLFLAASPLSSISSVSSIIKFSDDLFGAYPKYHSGCSRDYAKTLLTF